MKIRAYGLAIFLIVFVFGGITVSDQLGWWQTTSQKVPVTIDNGDFAGQADPMDIRGSYLFTEIENNFDVPLADLASAFQLSESQAASFKAKDLESIDFATPEKDIGTGSIRTFVAFYIGMSPDQITVSDLPASAVMVLLENGKVSESTREYLNNLTS
jgi:hypothetical protein